MGCWRRRSVAAASLLGSNAEGDEQGSFHLANSILGEKTAEGTRIQERFVQAHNLFT